MYFSDKTIPLEKVAQSGAINLQLIGVNKDIYSLPTNKLTFNVITADTRTPEITDIQLLEVTQTTAKIQFTCSDIATGYYVLALKGTAQPDLDELKSLGPAEFESTESRYGIYYVGQEQTGTLSFDGLTAETDYVVYVLLQDRGFNVIEAPGFIEFKTKSSLRSPRPVQRRLRHSALQPELHQLRGAAAHLAEDRLPAEPAAREGRREQVPVLGPAAHQASDRRPPVCGAKDRGAGQQRPKSAT